MAVEDRELEAAGGQSNDALATKRSRDPVEDIPARRRYMNEKGDSLATRFWKRRLLLAGAGIGVSLVAAIIAFIFALLPLKLEHLMKSFEQKFGSATEHVIEKRVEKATTYYLIKRAQGINFTGCTAVEGGKICDPIMTSGSVWKDTFKNWQASKFEARLEAEQGIRFYSFTNQKGVHRMGVHSRQAGTDFNFDTADFDAGKDVFKDHKQARVAINQAVRNQTKWHQVFKRRFYRDLLRTKYHVKKWRIFAKQRDAVNETATAARTRLLTYANENILRPVIGDKVGDYLKCIIESGCAEGDLNTDVPSYKASIDERNAAGAAEEAALRSTCAASDCSNAKDTPPDTQDNPQTRDSKDKKNQANGAIRTMANDGITLAVDKLAGEEVAKQVRDLLEKEIVKKITGVAGLGTMAMVATLDDVLWNDKVGNVIEAQKKAQYVATSSMWDTMNDEFKDGHMSGPEVDAMNTQLEGTEKSRLFSYDFHLPRYDASNKIIKEAAAATKVPDCTDGHYLTEQEVLCPNKKVNSTTGASTAYKGSELGKLVHPVAEAYRGTIGGIVDFVVNIAGDILAPVANLLLKLPGLSQLFGSFADLVSSLVAQVIPIVSTGMENGAPLYESIRIGKDVAAQDTGHFTIGGQKLTVPQQVSLQQEVDKDQQIADAQGGLWQKLTNFDNVNSAGSRLMASLPFTRQGVANQFASVIINPLHAVAALNPLTISFAETSGDPADVDHYGYDVNDPALDRSPASQEFDNCDQIEKDWAQKTHDNPDGNNGTDFCRLEAVAAGSAGPTSTTEDDGGIGSGGTPPECGQTSAPASNNLYLLGDSFTVGAKAAGIEDKLKNAGYTQVTIDGSTGRSITGGGSDGNQLSGEEASKSISGANTVIVELGTNPAGTQADTLKSQIPTILTNIRKNSPSAKIYWVKIASTVSGSDYDARNKVIEDGASAGNYTVISPARISGLHPGNYDSYTQQIVNGLGATGSGAASCGAPTGGFTNPFPDGWVPNRLDMGYDGTFKGHIVAPFDGTITYAGPFNGWNGSLGLIIKADKDVGLPTRSLFFTEGVKPTVGSGIHVTAGTPIADPVPSPYGDAYGQGSTGGIEWGVSQDGPSGSQVDTYAIALGNCSDRAKSMVLEFAKWAEEKLGVDKPSATDHAGCA